MFRLSAPTLSDANLTPGQVFSSLHDLSCHCSLVFLVAPRVLALCDFAGVGPALHGRHLAGFGIARRNRLVVIGLVAELALKLDIAQDVARVCDRLKRARAGFTAQVMHVTDMGLVVLANRIWIEAENATACLA